MNKRTIIIICLACLAILVIFIVSYFIITKRGAVDVLVGITCRDENGDIVGSAEVKYLSPTTEVIGLTDTSGRIETWVKGIRRNGSRKIEVEAQKTGYGSTSHIFDIPGSAPNQEVELKMWRNLRLDVTWNYARRGMPKTPVAGGKVTLEGGMVEGSTETTTNNEGRASYIFKAVKGTKLKVSGSKPDMAPPYPMEPVVTELTNYAVELRSGCVPKTIEVIVTGLENPSDINGIGLRVDNLPVSTRIENDRIIYSGCFYESDAYDQYRKKVGISHPEYNFVPHEKTFLITKENTYRMETRAVRRIVQVFIVQCTEESGSPLLGAEVFLNGTPTGKSTDRNGSVTVSGQFKKGDSVNVTLSKTSGDIVYDFTYVSGNVFNITDQREYTLTATAKPIKRREPVEPVKVSIRCFDQNGNNLSGVSITSSDGAISGVTDNNGVSSNTASPGQPLTLSFSRDGFLTDGNINLTTPGRGEVSLNRYMLDLSPPKCSIGIGEFEFNPPELAERESVKARLFKGFISDKLDVDYGFSIVTDGVSGIKSDEARRGWGNNIRADVILIPRLTQGDEERGRIGLSAFLFQKQIGPATSPTQEYGSNDRPADVVDNLIRKLMEEFPYMGYVTNAADDMRVRMGRKQNIKDGDGLRIFRTIRDGEGRITGTGSQIVRAKVTRVVDDNECIARVEAPGTGTVSAGDLAIRRDGDQYVRVNLTVRDPNRNPLGDVNLYHGESRLYGGKTGRDGRTSFRILRGVRVLISGSTTGWRVRGEVMAMTDGEEVSLVAEPEEYSISIDSDSPGCSVSINGKTVGNAPIRNYKVSEGDHTLKLSGQAGEREAKIQIPYKGDRDRLRRSSGIEYTQEGNNISIKMDLVIPLDEWRRKEVERLVSIEDEKSYKEAIDALTLVSSFVKDDYLEARQWAGVIYSEKLKDYDNAIAMFKSAIVREYRYAAAYYNLGWCYYQKGDYNSAIKNFDEVFRYQAFLDKKDAPRILHDTWYFISKAYYGEFKRTGSNKSQVIAKCLDYLDFKIDDTVNTQHYDNCRDEINNILKEVR